MLWNTVNYTADISYLNNIFIMEYDIAKCNINVLYSNGVIDKNTYDYLYKAERMTRQIYIGKLQKENPEVTKILKNGIIEAKKMFFEANGIQDTDVLSIKNDAVFLINKKPNKTKFGLIEFSSKGVYTSFCKLRGLEVYYYYNGISETEYVDVKGISQENLANHESWFLQFIKDVFYFIQVRTPELCLKMIKDFYLDYINRRLSVEYYREFNSFSDYKYSMGTNAISSYRCDEAKEADKPYLDITYNLSVIMQIQKYVINMYFNKH